MRVPAVVLVAVGLVAAVGCAPKQAAEDEILFGRKRFSVIPFGPGQEAVFVSGTLTGEGVASRNNTMAIYCDQETMECTIIDVVQVGPNQVGDLQVPLRSLASDTFHSKFNWLASLMMSGSSAVSENS